MGSKLFDLFAILLRRVYTDIPNSAYRELIALNKKMYPEVFLR